ncbi:unnamed protein product [Vitrella brassicaformis CCMP3155]|uniref:Uncharacterized protein n=2 Tax=Vitrella brassicaformis TaxID=1169539 RepID=A0A0G4FB65_VITBC|nr:unnamed protein product [Vitrella brassicaformis CCMP3155]|eukprot:CEM10183.1 unnamed protein product [Vitrella brassicaformis CCMP3155]
MGCVSSAQRFKSDVTASGPDRGASAPVVEPPRRVPKLRICDVELKLSVPDLIDSGVLYYDFLSTATSCRDLFRPEVLRNAIRRYIECWLPLLNDVSEASRGANALAAPLDIEWVWHCHLLEPAACREDIRRLNLSPGTRAPDEYKYARYLFDHQLRAPRAHRLAMSTSEKLWKEMYPDEPFHIIDPDDPRTILVDTDELVAAHQGEGRKSVLALVQYDLYEASLRQKTFAYQVALPHYRDRVFLSDQVYRYTEYLRIKKLYPQSAAPQNALILPTVGIDLVWQTHMMFPNRYIQDLHLYLGRVLHHKVDSLKYREEPSRLREAWAYTEELWHAEFACSPRDPGALYRGTPPVEAPHLPIKIPKPISVISAGVASLRSAGGQTLLMKLLRTLREILENPLDTKLRSFQYRPSKQLELEKRFNELTVSLGFKASSRRPPGGEIEIVLETVDPLSLYFYCELVPAPVPGVRREGQPVLRKAPSLIGDASKVVPILSFFRPPHAERLSSIRYVGQRHLSTAQILSEAPSPQLTLTRHYGRLRQIDVGPNQPQELKPHAEVYESVLAKQVPGLPSRLCSSGSVCPLARWQGGPADVPLRDCDLREDHTIKTNTVLRAKVIQIHLGNDFGATVQIQAMESCTSLATSHLLGPECLPPASVGVDSPSLSAGEAAMLVRGRDGDFCLIIGSWKGIIQPKNKGELPDPGRLGVRVFLVGARKPFEPRIERDAPPGGSRSGTPSNIMRLRPNLRESDMMGSPHGREVPVWQPSVLNIARNFKDLMTWYVQFGEARVRYGLARGEVSHEGDDGAVDQFHAELVAVGYSLSLLTVLLCPVVPPPSASTSPELPAGSIFYNLTNLEWCLSVGSRPHAQVNPRERERVLSNADGVDVGCGDPLSALCASGVMVKEVEWRPGAPVQLACGRGGTE